MCENEATEDEDEVDAEAEDDESEKDVEQLGDVEDLPPPVNVKNEDNELTSATVAAVRAGASEISYPFLCKRVLRFLRRRFEHFYDTPAAVAATRDTLVPLLYSPNPTTATLAAVALRGLANVAPRRYRARLARALALPVYKALLAAPLTSPMLVGALADCLDRCCTVSQRAVYEMVAVGSPVAVPLPSAGAVVATDNDKNYRADAVRAMMTTTARPRARMTMLLLSATARNNAATASCAHSTILPWTCCRIPLTTAPKSNYCDWLSARCAHCHALGAPTAI